MHECRPAGLIERPASPPGVCDPSTVIPDGPSAQSHCHKALKSKIIGHIIRTRGIAAALPKCDRVSPACPIVGTKRMPNEASSRVLFSEPEILEVDSDLCSFPTTKHRRCADSGSEGSQPKGLTVYNVWRTHEVRQYMEENESKLERRLEIFLATADALRKAREIQLELGVPRRKLLFPVVWTMSYAFIFFPEVDCT